ncbi:THY1 Predicted alternative thymidylate synthase [uncultured Caudovirales phage]|uniref:THY1 Predicted alternative thymidylate synthase n=1 Tax=uncultured Caudovirales phage TaxID=2100421 RepID=A0A6J5M034_9CAUD|nr:THY1 Predicted alternative thymidylate synthase [uncultured Caudovirales phage]
MTVSLVWATPDADRLVAYMARVSAPQNQNNDATAPRLIGYLIRHRHWSPFEMVNLCVEVDTTRDIARQLLRHRSFTFQEFSQRYADVGDLPPAPFREARLKHPTNRQASVPTTDEVLAAWWKNAQDDVRAAAETAYQIALEYGIAKEVARAVLPEGLTMSRLYMNGSLRSWLHFCDLRRGPETQKETRDVAEAAWAVLRQACPAICEAWEAA